MFERLIHNNIPFAQLTEQRRMRPEIKEMLNIIYPKLTSHPSVKEHPHVKGISSNLFFYDHKYNEEKYLVKSKKNEGEAEMILRFAIYLVG